MSPGHVFCRGRGRRRPEQRSPLHRVSGPPHPALPGTTIEILERRGAFSRVFVTSRGVHMLGTAAFLARASDLETCSLLRN